MPRRPTWPGLDDFPGEVLHARDYRSGEPFAEQRVLVVGCGNSGAEIALDLWECGASRVLMVVRGPLHVLPRDFAGLPAQVSGLLLQHLPRALADRIGAAVAKRAFGDLSPYGIVRPAVGPITQVAVHGRVPLIDVGTIELVRQGEIEVVPGIERFEASTVVFEDARITEVDAVVLATGYRAGLEDFLPCVERVVDSRGYPTRHGEEAEVAGLYFVGYRNPPTGQLHDIGREAPRVAASIAAGSR